MQYEMLEKLENSTLQTIVLKVKDIHWKKKGKELIIENSLFDVKNIEKINNSTYKVIGLFDKEEKKIMEDVELIAKKNNSNKSAIIFNQLFSATSLTPEAEYCFSFSSTLKTELNFYYFNTLPIIHLNIINPPPEFII